MATFGEAKMLRTKPRTHLRDKTRGRSTIATIVTKSMTSPTSYRNVQNGSDVRGVALGDPEAVTLTPSMVRNIARAFAVTLGKDSGAVSVGVGRDSRVTGQALGKEALQGIVEAGDNCSAIDLGIATTPAMFMSTITPGFRYSGSIMLTASHLPYDRNGMKFFTESGGLGKSDIARILDLAEEYDGAELPQLSHSQVERISEAIFIPTYAKTLRDTIVAEVGEGETPLAGLKIIVDAGNGAGGFFADQVLAPLGADVSGSQFLDPDGMFPNHVPNPEDAEAMESVTAAVLREGADLGVIFDTDVDRSGIVDSKGTVFNKNRLIAAMAAITLRGCPGGTIVTDSVTSDALTTFIDSRGGNHLRYKRGYKNVIEKGKEIENCPLMIETSGHGAMAENHYLDDGAYMAVKMIIEAARRDGDLAGLVEGFQEPLEAREYRVKYSKDAPSGYSEEIIRAFEEFCDSERSPGDWKSASDNFEGWRVSVLDGEGWVLMRRSLHDPLLVINAETNVKGGVSKAMGVMRTFLEPYTYLDKLD